LAFFAQIWSWDDLIKVAFSSIETEKWRFISDLHNKPSTSGDGKSSLNTNLAMGHSCGGQFWINIFCFVTIFLYFPFLN